jgi:hypothetical protein
MSEYLVVNEHEGETCGAYCPDRPGVGVAAKRFPSRPQSQNNPRRGARHLNAFRAGVLELGAERIVI